MTNKNHHHSKKYQPRRQYHQFNKQTLLRRRKLQEGGDKYTELVINQPNKPFLENEELLHRKHSLPRAEYLYNSHYRPSKGSLIRKRGKFEGGTDEETEIETEREITGYTNRRKRRRLRNDRFLNRQTDILLPE